MNEEEKGLVEKKPSFFKRLFYFLFIDSSLEDSDDEEYEDGIELEEISLDSSYGQTEEVVAGEGPEELEDDEEDDISDYSEEDIENLQRSYEAGSTDLDSLTTTQINLLFSLYMNQIEEISKSNEEKRQKLLEYRDSMKNN